MKTSEFITYLNSQATSEEKLAKAFEALDSNLLIEFVCKLAENSLSVVEPSLINPRSIAGLQAVRNHIQGSLGEDEYLQAANDADRVVSVKRQERIEMLVADTAARACAAAAAAAFSAGNAPYSCELSSRTLALAKVADLWSACQIDESKKDKAFSAFTAERSKIRESQISLLIDMLSKEANND